MTDRQLETEVQRRLSLPYHRGIFGDPVDGYTGHIAELPGCHTSGDTPGEALDNLTEAIAAWRESSLVSGDAIRDPAPALAPVA